MHIFVLGVLLLCLCIISAALSHLEAHLADEPAIQAEPDERSHSYDLTTPQTPVAPARRVTYRASLPARAQYRLPEIRLRLLRDQEIADRDRAARQLRIPTATVKGYFALALKRRQSERAQCSDHVLRGPEDEPLTPAGSLHSLASETGQPDKSSPSLVNPILTQAPPPSSASLKRRREYENETRRLKGIPATGGKHKPLFGWQLRVNEDSAMQYLWNRFGESAMDWRSTPNLAPSHWQQQSATETDDEDISMDETTEKEVLLHLDRPVDHQKQFPSAYIAETAIDDISAPVTQSPVAVASQWNQTREHDVGDDSIMKDLAEPGITTPQARILNAEQTTTAQEMALDPIEASSSPLSSPPASPLEPPPDPHTHQTAPLSNAASHTEPEVVQHSPPSNKDAIAEPQGHPDLPIRENEEMYPRSNHRPLFNCATVSEAKALFIRWMEFNEQRIYASPPYFINREEDKWVTDRILHTQCMIQKQSQPWEKSRYTRQEFTRELQDHFSGSDLEGCMMRTASKLREIREETKCWRSYVRVIEYLQTPYGELMKRFERGDYY